MKDLNKDVEDVTLEEIIRYIENGSQDKVLIRKIDDNISIRNGKYGHYVYYKTKKMKKPKFCGLGKQNIDDFMKDFKTPQDLKDWATEFKPKKFTRGKKF